MGNARGLRTRLCPRCKELTPHRTLYAKTESGGRTKWFRLFWVCSGCGSLNHILLPRYRLESASSQLPSTFCTAVVNVLIEGPLDFDELVSGLRQRRVEGIRHVFNSEVAMALEYLKGRGVVAEEDEDRTVKTLDSLRARAESKVIGPCTAAQSGDTLHTALISLYAQRRTRIDRGPGLPPVEQMRLISVGILCLSCRHYRIDQELFSKPPAVAEAPVART